MSRIHGFSFIPWLGILIWAYVKPRQIGWASLVLAAWITFCSIVFLLVPNYTLTLRGLNSNDRLEFVVIMIIFGLPAMIWMLKRDVHDWWCCRNCDYDLHGISSDTCPECGCPIARETRSRLNAPSPDQS